MTRTVCGCCLKPGQFPDPNDLKPPDPDCRFCDGTGELKRTVPIGMNKEKLARLETLLERAMTAWRTFCWDRAGLINRLQEEQEQEEFDSLVKEAISLLSKGE